MTKNIDDDQDYENDGDDVFDDFEVDESASHVLKGHLDARRRLEQIREDRELERLINDDYYGWGS